MNRLDAIQIIIGNLSGDELIVHANGAISRESFYCRDRRENIYLLGSMGLASSVGLGLALCLPGKTVMVLDGDGNILMGYGNLALIGALKPKNLIHVVLDNGAYETTGNQPTISPHINLSEAARASGYPQTHRCTTRNKLSAILRDFAQGKGPCLIHTLVSQETTRKCPRIPYNAEEIKIRFVQQRNG